MDDIVFLFDVDNTLLDNDRVQADLGAHLGDDVRRRRRATATGRSSRSCAASSATPTISARSSATGSRTCTIRALLRMSNWLVDYPFAERLYPGRAGRRAARRGNGAGRSSCPTATRCSSRARSSAPACGRRSTDNVLIYIHKEQELDDVERLYPAQHYVLIDDKLRILAAVKEIWGDRVTTVFPRQGHYAHDPEIAGGLSAGRHHGRAHRRPCWRIDRADFAPNELKGVQR